ncbi:hypothetical protein OYC64_011648 [Pagothenia borchgrevinki]|uniref:Uncharacterized protein n=1 Tax=Pagothenia borchgrevinki TaxID=8213 RepID=A0ABD2FGN7_PAGBO
MRGLTLLCFLGFILTVSSATKWPAGSQLPMQNPAGFNTTINSTMVNKTRLIDSNAEWNGIRTNVDNSAGFPPSAEEEDTQKHMAKPSFIQPFSGVAGFKPTVRQRRTRRPTVRPLFVHPFVSGGGFKPTDTVPQVEQK